MGFDNSEKEIDAAIVELRNQLQGNDVTISELEA
jgi:hypothetical protein